MLLDIISIIMSMIRKSIISIIYYYQCKVQQNLIANLPMAAFSLPPPLFFILMVLILPPSSNEMIGPENIRVLQMTPLQTMAYSSYTSIQIFQLLNWQANDRMIQQINQNQNRTFNASHNQFSYLSMAEIQEKYLNLQPEYLTQIKVQASLYGQSNSYSLALKPTVLTALNGTPTSVENYNYDWRGSLVSSVKNQGICGACWAFAGTADIETSYILKYRLQIDLSEQQLVDCSRPYGNSGCGGGMMNNAFQYVVDNGLTLESYYPYQQVARNCKYDPNVMPHFSIKGSIVIERDCNALAGILKQRPVSVVISANPSFIFYQKGILNSCGKNINHALQLVGMVKNYEESYYIGKNSWGVAWGMKGYVFIDSSEEAGNLCSVCEFPQYPI